MHELSLAENLVTLAIEALEQGAAGSGMAGPRVDAVNLRVGLISGVEEESLLFCYGIVVEGTPLAGSRLIIHDVPVSIFCRSCQDERELPGIQSFLCPVCGEPSSDVCRGKEMELVSIELFDQSPQTPD